MSTNPHTAKKLSEASSFAPKSGPLSDANADFHVTYNQLVNEGTARLGTTVPVVILLGGHLILVHEGTETTEHTIPPDYHRLKAYSHVAFGLQLALMANGEGSLSDNVADQLRSKLKHIKTAVDEIPNDELPAEQLVAPAEVLQLSATMINETLHADKVDMSLVVQFARNVAPLVLQNAAFAVRAELNRMHELVSVWRKQLGEETWQNLYVVICGGHQPRYRDAAKQYFQRLLHEVDGLGAEMEDRVLYGEGIRDVDGAMDLLARHVIDQEASNMFFGNKNRLQEDLLADVATEYLKELLPDG